MSSAGGSDREETPPCLQAARAHFTDLTRRRPALLNLAKLHDPQVFHINPRVIGIGRLENGEVHLLVLPREVALVGGRIGKAAHLMGAGLYRALWQHHLTIRRGPVCN